MPFAVTHVLFPIIVLELLKKRSRKIKKNLSPHLLLAAGIFGLLPDIDVILEIIFYALYGTLWGVHRAVTHSLLIPLILFFLAFLFLKNKKIFTLFLVGAFGWATHILLDFLLVGEVALFFPLLPGSWGLSLLVGPSVSEQAAIYLLSGLDAVVFLAWIWHEEKYRKLRDFL